MNLLGINLIDHFKPTLYGALDLKLEKSLNHVTKTMTEIIFTHSSSDMVSPSPGFGIHLGNLFGNSIGEALFGEAVRSLNEKSPR